MKNTQNRTFEIRLVSYNTNSPNSKNQFITNQVSIKTFESYKQAFDYCLTFTTPHLYQLPQEIYDQVYLFFKQVKNNPYSKDIYIHPYIIENGKELTNFYGRHVFTLG